MSTIKRASPWTRYKQLSIRIGSGKAAQDYLARIDAAAKKDRRRRADWLRLVIDLALEAAEKADMPTKA